MDHTSVPLAHRLEMLGFPAREVPLDRWSSPIAALACFPMYMVANVHAWTSDQQFKIPVLNIPGFEAVREAIEIGKQEGPLGIDAADARVVDSMLSTAKAADQVIYQYALETLSDFLSTASPGLVDQVRTFVAQSIVAIAKASGEGLFGTGPKVGPEERSCIEHIVSTLNLPATPAAAKIAYGLDKI